jgi:hypothetical protein
VVLVAGFDGVDVLEMVVIANAFQAQFNLATAKLS